MIDEREPSSGFKVIDRRSFSTDGTPVEGQSATEEQKTEPEPQPQLRSSTGSGTKIEPEDHAPESSREFETLVSYLSTTAMFQLGLLPGPGGEQIPLDLANARRTINLLEVLQVKTRGNLTDDEASLIEEVLYELRMNYLEVEKQMTIRRK